MADHIVHRLGRHDIAFTLIGSGDCYDELVELSHRLGLTELRHLHRPNSRRRRRGDSFDGRRGHLARPEEPLQRPLHHEQDHGVHDFRAPRWSHSTCRRPGSRHGDAAVYATPNDVEELREVAASTWSTTNPDGVRWGARPSTNRTGARLGASGSSLRRYLREACWRIRRNPSLRLPEADMCGIAGAYQQIDGRAAARQDGPDASTIEVLTRQGSFPTATDEWMCTSPTAVFRSSMSNMASSLW